MEVTDKKRKFTGLWLMLILFIALPLINNFALNYLYNFKLAGVSSREVWSVMVSGVMKFGNLITMFGVFTYIAIALMYKNTLPVWGVFLMGVGSFLLQYIGIFLSTLPSIGKSYISQLAVYDLLMFLLAVIMLAVVLLALVVFRHVLMGKLTPKYVIISTVAIYLAFNLGTLIGNTINDISAYGAPGNFSEWQYLIMPFVYQLLYAVSGGLISYLIMFINRPAKAVPEKDETPTKDN